MQITEEMTNVFKLEQRPVLDENEDQDDDEDDFDDE